MKKVILLSGVLCLLASFSADASEYPRGSDERRSYSIDQYWNQFYLSQEYRDRERMREEARDNGHHYAYGKNPRHHKEGWKNRPKHNGKSYGDSRPRDPNKKYDKLGNKLHENN